MIAESIAVLLMSGIPNTNSQKDLMFQMQFIEEANSDENIIELFEKLNNPSIQSQEIDESQRNELIQTILNSVNISDNLKTFIRNRR